MSFQDLTKTIALGVTIAALTAGTAFAQAKPLSALSKADELFIEYQFSNSVKWCFNHWRMMLIDPRNSMRTTIDVDMREGSITFEDKGLSRKVICEQKGMRTIFDGEEKFESYP
jgi:hypothetical protein